MLRTDDLSDYLPTPLGPVRVLAVPSDPGVRGLRVETGAFRFDAGPTTRAVEAWAVLWELAADQECVALVQLALEELDGVGAGSVAGSVGLVREASGLELRVAGPDERQLIADVAEGLGPGWWDEHLRDVVNSSGGVEAWVRVEAGQGVITWQLPLLAGERSTLAATVCWAAAGAGDDSVVVAARRSTGALLGSRSASAAPTP